MGRTGAGTQSVKLGPLDRANHVASAAEASLAEACKLASTPLRLHHTGWPKLAASTGARVWRANRELVGPISAAGAKTLGARGIGWLACIRGTVWGEVWPWCELS